MKIYPALRSHASLISIVGVGILCSFPSIALADKPPAIKVKTLAKSTTSWNGDTLPAYPAGQPEVTVLRITIPPGMQLPLHEHPVINAGVLVKGELQINTKDGESKLLKAGDALIELVNEWHYGANNSAEDAVIFVVYAGIEGPRSPSWPTNPSRIGAKTASPSKTFISLCGRTRCSRRQICLP